MIYYRKYAYTFPSPYIWFLSKQSLTDTKFLGQTSILILENKKNLIHSLVFLYFYPLPTHNAYKALKYCVIIEITGKVGLLVVRKCTLEVRLFTVMPQKTMKSKPCWEERN